MVKHIPRAQRFHLIVDASDCDLALLDDEAFLVELIHKITKKIGMSIIKGPICAKGIPENPGVSAFAIIDYSHISIHTFTNSGEFSLDVFSCKPFEYAKAEELIKESFNLTDAQVSRLVVDSSSLS